VADSKIDLIKAVPLFARLSRGELEQVAQLADEVNVPAGHILMRQGANGAEAFILASGAASSERDGRPLATYGPGALIGEIALLSEGPRTATVTTTAESHLLVLGHRELHSLMEAVPAIQACVFDDMARRLRELLPDAP
jgi:CRP-like cAMP-binding protein